jgi:hypothetical protein
MRCTYGESRRSKPGFCVCEECWLDFREPERRMARALDEARRLAEEWRDYCERECVPHHSSCAEPPPETLPWEVRE